MSKKSGSEPTVDAVAEVEADDAATDDKGATPGKGRPTPKRREAQNRKRGPVAPPPMTRAEARARRKEQKQTLTKDERKELRAQRNQQRSEQREKMLAGDDKYLPARDRGPVRAYARDIVDSRRNLAGLFMPVAILVLAAAMVPKLAVYMNLALMLFIVLMLLDATYLGRKVNKAVREKFPDTTDTGFRLGLYAAIRSMQLRMMRAPKPRVRPGDKV
ncbi:MAG: DUF3043 domain-containing protein [Gordonia sp. (in: high G+C Gram-positive bacteria)]